MTEPIAIVGIGCRLPGAEGPREYWQLLRDEVRAIGEIPRDRWSNEDIPRLWPATRAHASASRGGFLADGDAFDRELFGISGPEAEKMDPQQGMALELAWHALEDAGIASQSLRACPVAVFIGVSSRDFERRVSADLHRADLHSALGASGSVVANRISYTLGLTGPSITVDVGCASSLVSVHLACQSLRLQECELALAGGVQLTLSPASVIAMSQGRVLSHDGECRSFSELGSGYLIGEGGGMVVLRRLSDAIRNNDRIYAVIAGSAVNHNGVSNGLCAPLGPAQSKAIEAALSAAQAPPSTVGYVEAHGSGTRLGDAIEVKSIRRSLAKGRSASDLCYIGSVKPNIGHLESAAGIASLLKAVLILHHGVIPKSLNATPVSPDLGLSGTPFRIATESVPWPRTGTRRRAGVSAFSFGGANAHVILDEAPSLPAAASAVPSDTTRPLLLISAQSDSALRTLASRYADVLSNAHANVSLADLCYSATTCRTHLSHRLALRADSSRQAHSTLTRYLAGDVTEDVWLSNGRCTLGTAGRATLDSAPADPPARTAVAYISGAQLNWPTLVTSARRCELPLYPMQRRRHWKPTDHSRQC